MKKLTPSDEDAMPPSAPPGRAGGARALDRARSLLSEALLLVICGIFWVQTTSFEQEGAEGLGPTFVPRLLIVLLVVCALARMLQKVLAWPRGEPSVAAPREHTGDGQLHVEEGAIAEEDYPSSTRHLLLGIALAVGYVLGTTYLGYPLATLLVVVVFVWTASRLTWVTLAVAFGIALTFPYIFVKVVFIDLPRGVGVFDDFTVWLYNLLGIY